MCSFHPLYSPPPLPRKDDGTLRRYEFPGGYEIVYLDKDNATLCADCANKSEAEKDDWPDQVPVAATLSEESDWWCAECNYHGKAEYGEAEQ